MLNLASTNFAGLAGSERIKEKAVECLRRYGVGSCGPPGFYGTFGTRLFLSLSPPPLCTSAPPTARPDDPA